MANTILTPEIIASQALASLHETLVMQPLVYTDISQDFTGPTKVGDTVNVRKPAVFEANRFNRAEGIKIQNAVEGSVPVKMDQISDVSFEVTSEELTLDIEKFDEQFLTPAMQAIALDIDSAILGLRSDIAASVGGTADPDFPWNKPEVLIDAERVLNRNKLPQQDRRAVVGTDFKARWSNSELIKRADTSGDTQGLRESNIGRRLFGFDAYWTQNVESPAATPAQGDPTTEVGVAFHKTAFAFVSAPLAVAPGSFASVVNHNGISIRVAYQYDLNHKATTVSVDTLFGVKTLDVNRAVLLKGDDAA